MKIIKRNLAIILSVAMMFTTTFTPLIVQADVTSYLDYSKQAVQTTNSLLKSMGVDKMGNVGAGLTTFLNGLGTGLGLTNTILKFFGFGKKSGPDTIQLMYKEIQDMHADLLDIGQDVRDLTNTMSDYIVEDKFDKQVTAAKKANEHWYNFNQTYVENGMEELEEQYQALIREELKNWFARGKRNEEGFDNTKIIILYDEEGNLVFSDTNSLPNKYKTTGKYFEIYSNCFDSSYEGWKMDSYEQIFREKVGATIENSLNGASGSKSADSYFEQRGFSIFSPAAWKKATPEEQKESIDKVCADAIEVLLYRLSLVASNRNSSFSTKVKSAFNNYCKNLVDVQDQGLDAILQAMKLTNNFEGELREDYMNLCANIMVQTGEFATFTLDVAGKDNSCTESDANKLAKSWLHAVEEIQSAVDSLTGYDNYCYTTGTLVEIVPLLTFCSCDIKQDGSDIKEVNITRLNVESADKTYTGDLSATRVGTEKTMIMNNLFLSRLSKGDNTTFNEYIRKYTYGKYKHVDWYNYNMDCKNEYLLTDWSQKDITQSDDIMFNGSWIGKGYKDHVKINNKSLDYSNARNRRKLVGNVFEKDSNTIKRDKLIRAWLIWYKSGGKDGWFYHTDNISGGCDDYKKNPHVTYWSSRMAESFTIVKTPLPESVRDKNATSTASVVAGINPLYICGAVILIIGIVVLVLRSRKKDSAKNKE